MRIRQLTKVAMALAGCVCAPYVQQQAFAAKPHVMTIQRGILTVDGMPGRTALELQIADFRYLYLYVPGSGTTVVSDRAFPGATEQRSAFRGAVLTVRSGEKRLQLTAAHRLHSTHSAWVRFEPGDRPGMRLPAVGFGDVATVPAVWPDEGSPARGARLGMRVKARRASRTGKLCRPSPHGRELCATVHEVFYQPKR